MTLSVGKKAPNFEVIATNAGVIKRADYEGKNNLVLYFYPKDATPGCTTEGQNFRDLKSEFDKADCVIFGVSRDSIKSHEKFIDKQSFNFELISDENEKLCQQFDVIKEKNMYGKKYMGIERSTFLIDKAGNLAFEWRKVRVKGHVDEVLEAARSL